MASIVERSRVYHVLVHKQKVEQIYDIGLAYSKLAEAARRGSCLHLPDVFLPHTREELEEEMRNSACRDGDPSSATMTDWWPLLSTWEKKNVAHYEATWEKTRK